MEAEGNGDDGSGYHIDLVAGTLKEIYFQISNGENVKTLRVLVSVLNLLCKDEPRPAVDPVVDHAEKHLFQLIEQGADIKDIKLQAEGVQRLKAPLTSGKFRFRFVWVQFTNVIFRSSSTGEEQRERIRRTERTRAREPTGECAIQSISERPRTRTATFKISGVFILTWRSLRFSFTSPR